MVILERLHLSAFARVCHWIRPQEWKVVAEPEVLAEPENAVFCHVSGDSGASLPLASFSRHCRAFWPLKCKTRPSKWARQWACSMISSFFVKRRSVLRSNLRKLGIFELGKVGLWLDKESDLPPFCCKWLVTVVWGHLVRVNLSHPFIFNKREYVLIA